jgi:serpin B
LQVRIGSFLLFLCLAVVSISGFPASAAEAPGEAAEAINAFAVDVYLQLARKENGFFFSPYSVSSALAIASAGAGGETAREMAKALHLDELKSPHLAMKSLMDRFEAIRENADYGKGDVFDVANRIWLDKEEELLPDYTALAELNYSGAVEPVDFKRDAEGARQTINAWVEQKTRGKIKDLLHRGAVNSMTRLVLTNAVYFNSEWRKPFDKKWTRPEPFHAGKGEAKDIPMMRMTDSFLYGEEADLQFIKIPYRLSGFSLLVLLPRANDTFTQMAELEKRLSAQQISD